MAGNPFDDTHFQWLFNQIAQSCLRNREDAESGIRQLGHDGYYEKWSKDVNKAVDEAIDFERRHAEWCLEAGSPDSQPFAEERETRLAEFFNGNAFAVMWECRAAYRIEQAFAEGRARHELTRGGAGKRGCDSDIQPMADHDDEYRNAANRASFDVRGLVAGLHDFFLSLAASNLNDAADAYVDIFLVPTGRFCTAALSFDRMREDLHHWVKQPVSEFGCTAPTYHELGFSVAQCVLSDIEFGAGMTPSTESDDLPARPLRLFGRGGETPVDHGVVRSLIGRNGQRVTMFAKGFRPGFPDMPWLETQIKLELSRFLRFLREEGPRTKPSAPGKRQDPSRKRSTVKGEARAKIISGLTAHHKYDNGSCANLDPINVSEFAKSIGVSKSTVSDFLKDRFGGFAKYRGFFCKDAKTLATSISLLRGELPPSILYNRIADENRESDAED